MGTMIFTVTLCLLCSFMITGTAELLKERKLAKQRDEIKRFVLIASNVEVAEGQDFRSVFDERVTPKLINLNTGDAEAMATADIMNFDERMAAINPQTATKPKKTPLEFVAALKMSESLRSEMTRASWLV